MRHLIVVGLAGVLITLLACGSMPILHPKTGPGTPYPCGINGIQCPDKLCCWENDVCGGEPFSGCPADSCCFAGDNNDPLGAHPPYKKLSPDQMLHSPSAEKQ